MSDKTTETRRPMVRPGCAVCETGDGRIQVKVEMPGVRQESLEVRIEGNELYGKTLGIIGLILTTVILNFNALFSAFHKIFFEGDTWLFYFSDTLIRLFPMRLWQDLFIAIGVFTIAGALFFAIKGRRWAER